MQPTVFTIAIGILGAAFGYLLSWMNSKRRIIECTSQGERQAAEQVRQALIEHRNSAEMTALLDLRFRDGHQAGSTEAIKIYKDSEGYEAMFAVEHSKGKDVGIIEEREKWQLTYTPIAINDEGYFSHTVETGFEMQIFYNGFPINDPLRRITQSHKKSKDENIQQFLDIAEKAVDVAVSIASKNKIPISIKSPRQERKS